MTDEIRKRHRKFQLRTAAYFSTGTQNEAGEAIYEIRLYKGGLLDESFSVMASMLPFELDALRKRGYPVTRIDTAHGSRSR